MAQFFWHFFHTGSQGKIFIEKIFGFSLSSEGNGGRKNVEILEEEQTDRKR